MYYKVTIRNSEIIPEKLTLLSKNTDGTLIIIIENNKNI